MPLVRRKGKELVAEAWELARECRLARVCRQEVGQMLLERQKKKELVAEVVLAREFQELPALAEHIRQQEENWHKMELELLELVHCIQKLVEHLHSLVVQRRSH